MSGKDDDCALFKETPCNGAADIAVRSRQQEHTPVKVMHVEILASRTQSVALKAFMII
jgi:hypothetical protein